MEERKYTIQDLDEYIRQGEPEKVEKTYLWRAAIGLQQVDGLKPSDFLVEKAKENIEGAISIEEVQRQLKTYYQSKVNREPNDDETEEADRVSANIAKLLSTNNLNFSVFGYCQVHRNIFDGVFKFAGKIREFDITKKEWVLRGDTVNYMYAADLHLALEYDIEQERQFNYGGLTTDEIIKHICKFVANLWQIHAFAEGNTRTTAVFTIQYLRSIGFDVNNDVFAENSWYFRNALVRYVYKNKNGVQPEPIFLERFFRNLLLGEHNELKNRYMIINPPEEWKMVNTPEQVPEQVPEQLPEQVPEQVGNLFMTDNKNILRLVAVIGTNQMSVKEMMAGVGLKQRPNFIEYSLNPSLKEGFVKMLYPDKPNHPRQKYLLTVKGLGVYNDYRNK